MHHKRRITEQLMEYWTQLEKEGPLPSIQALDPGQLQHCWSDCFIVEIIPDHTEPFGRNHRHDYQFLGESLRDLFSGDLSSASVLSITDMLAYCYHDVVQKKAPRTDEYELTTITQEQIKYRRILLPMGDASGAVTHVLGGWRCAIDRQSEN